MDPYDFLQMEYPSLSDSSDEEPNNPNKKVKTAEGSVNVTSQSEPQLDGFYIPGPNGTKIFVPAPPMGMRAQGPTHQAQPRVMRQPFDPNAINRDRKNLLYVKNIPKQFMSRDKLLIFFRNQGQVKDVKIVEQTSTAIVRFQRKEHASAFASSGKNIFNRSYIFYSLNENDLVPPSFIKQRENEENNLNKRPVEVEVKVLKEKLHEILADKVRACLFLAANFIEDGYRVTIQEELEEAKKLKDSITTLGELELKNFTDEGSNIYSWTLLFSLETLSPEVERKSLFQEFTPHGPISFLQAEQTNETKEEDVTKYTHSVRLRYLGIRSSWAAFCQQPDRFDLESSKLKNIFKSGLLRGTPEPTLTTQSTEKNN